MGGAFKFEPIKLALAAGLFALALLVGSPLIHAQQPGPVIAGQGTFGLPVATSNGHQQWGNGAPPVLSTCGTTPSTVVGTDAAFHFITGTSASSACTITPAVAHKLRPTCLVGTESATKPSFTVSVSGVLVLGSVQDATRYYVVCIDQPGGM